MPALETMTSLQKEDGSTEKQKYAAPAVVRAVAILELMAKNNRRYTVTELSTELKVSVNSVFRILQEFQKMDYVIKDSSDSSYELTPKLYYLGNSIRSRISLRRIAYQHMKRISQESKETVLLTTFGDNFSTLIMEQIESPLPIKFLSTVGHQYASYCSAMGKMMLAYLDSQEQTQYILNTDFVLVTSHTITDKNAFRAELEAIRKRGIAFDNEESCPGLSCIAAPVFSSGERLEGAIGISGVTFRMSEAQKADYASLVREECAKLSRSMGYSERDSISHIT